MIKAALIIAYIYGLFPFLMGITVSLFFHRKLHIAYAYVIGYLIYLSVFAVAVLLAEHKHISYTAFTRRWESIVCILSIIVIISVACAVLLSRKRFDDRTKKSLSGCSRDQYITAVLTLFLTALAVLFLVPHAFDETPELARLTLANNTFFSIDPATNAAYNGASSLPGLLHVLYSFGSTVTGINSTVLIHRIMPVFMIPFFVCSYIMITNLLFPGERHLKTRGFFIWFIILFYLLMLPLEAHLAMTPYRNIWNGITLAASCLFPLLTAVCVDLVRRFSVNTQKASDNCLLSLPEALIAFVCLILSIQLCVRFGLILCSLFAISTILIVIAFQGRRLFSDKHIENAPKGGMKS